VLAVAFSRDIQNLRHIFIKVIHKIHMLIRENLRNVANDATKIKRVREAFREIMERFDNQGYTYVANHHGWLENLCSHGPQIDDKGNIVHTFLPWHRAYLLKLEKLLQQREPDIALPWWDWRSKQSKKEGIPKALADARVGRELNPLNKFHIDIRGKDRDGNDIKVDRDTVRNPGRPEEIKSRQEILKLNQQDIPQLYDLSDFRQFSERLRIGWHNFIHVWIGGDMGVVETAAYDPIFYIHHCNVDRIWAIWQTRNGVDSIPSHMRDVVLQPFKMTVREVLDINSLNYEYASSSTF
jgi:tyrosinase